MGEEPKRRKEGRGSETQKRNTPPPEAFNICGPGEPAQTWPGHLGFGIHWEQYQTKQNHKVFPEPAGFIC